MHRNTPTNNAVHLSGVNKIPSPIDFCKSISNVTIIVYQIHVLCNLHISKTIELANNKDPPRNEESIKY